MFGRLTGTLAEKSPPQVLIDVQGVGYEVDVPMSSFYNLPALGERVTLLTHLVVREDAQLLYGFLTHDERTTFRLLVKISGIGPRTALSILSGLSVTELAQAVSLQESGRLVKVPGIGKKTAERLLLMLAGALSASPSLPLSSSSSRSAVFLPMPGTLTRRPLSCRLTACASSVTLSPDKMDSAVRGPMPEIFTSMRNVVRSS